MLADQGAVTCSGLELASGLQPAAGYTGPIQLGAVALEPTPKKWKDFTADAESGKAIQRRTPNGWKPLRPQDLEHCSKLSKPRVRLELAGLAIGPARPCVSALCEYNAAKALLARAFTKPKYTPTREAFQTLEAFTDVLLPGFVSQAPAEMSVQEWILSMPSRRRKALLRAAEAVLRDIWRKDWTTFKAFVKSEKLPGFEKLPHDEAVILTMMIDRLINGPMDEAHVLLGPHLKPLTCHLKRVWHNQSPIFYAATNVEKLDAWLKWAWQPGTIAVMADYSKFDNSHSDLSWDWVEGLYRRIGLQARDERIARVLREWRRPRGVMTGSGWALRYQAETMNASGRDDTALANALLNGGAMFLSLVATLRHKKVCDLNADDVAWGLNSVRLAVCGDDTLAFVPVPEDLSRFRTALSENVASFGFTAEGEKLIISDQPFDFVFLGMRPYPTKGGWAFGKTIGRALYKFGWKMDPKDCDLPAWYAGECQAVVRTQAHVPVLSDVAQAFLKQHGNGKVTAAEDWRERADYDAVFVAATAPYGPEAVAYVEQGYGLVPGAVNAALDELAGLVFPAVTNHPVFLRMIAHDDL